nr:methyltransferase domain-containing protein [Motiliproteus sediminis]
MTDKPTRVLDAGGGQGQMSAIWAAAGHSVTLVDAAEPMLQQAQLLLDERQLSQRVTLHHSTLQAYLPGAPQFSRILCHAVLEWTRDPRALVQQLAARLTPDGVLSLMFYNRHSLVLRNAMGGILVKLQQDKLAGDGRKLTPTNPIDPAAAYSWLEQAGLTIELKRGVRCLFDYMPRITQRAADFDDIIALERPLREQEPYRHMARYIHVVARRSAPA